MMEILRTNNLDIGYDRRLVISNLNLIIEKGEMVCLIGPNGSGKSTLLRTLAGIQRAIGGEVSVGGQVIDNHNIKKVSCLVAIVLTQKPVSLNFTVFDMVALGRIPHTNWLGQLTVLDKEKVMLALEMVGLEKYVSRQIDELSDGEKQRVMVAKALAQDTPIIILDEPTAHLDIINRIALLSLFKKLSRETGKAILLSTHELDMAIQVADSLWLMNNERGFRTGAPEDLVISGEIDNVFKGDLVRFDEQAGNFRMKYDLKKHIAVIGNGTLGNWTRKALQKEGFAISVLEDQPIVVSINESEEKPWQLTVNSNAVSLGSIGELIKTLRNG